MADRLRDYSKGLDAEVKERRERVKRTEDKIKGLISFIADRDRSDYVVSTLRDLEVQAKTDRAAIDRIQREAQEPLRLPSLSEISAAVLNLNKSITGEPTQGRARLKRWSKDGEIRVARTPDQGVVVRGAYLSLAVAAENENSRQSQGFGTAESNVRSGGSACASVYRVSRSNCGPEAPLATSWHCERTRSWLAMKMRCDFPPTISARAELDRCRQARLRDTALVARALCARLHRQDARGASGTARSRPGASPRRSRHAPPAPDQRTVRRYNAARDRDYPEDLPLDAIAAFDDMPLAWTSARVEHEIATEAHPGMPVVYWALMQGATPADARPQLEAWREAGASAAPESPDSVRGDAADAMLEWMAALGM